LCSNAQKYLIPLSDEAPKSKSIISSSKVKLQFSYPGINITQLNTDEGTFNQLNIPDTYKAGNVGEPELVSTNKIFTIPENSSVSVKIKSYTTEIIKLNNYTNNSKLLPLQPSPSKNTDKKQDFVYSKKAYQKNEFIEHPVAKIEVLGKMRDKKIVKLIVNPAQYNPVQNIIKFYNDIELEIDVKSSRLSKNKSNKTRK